MQKWFAECVLTETELFRRSYQMEYINHPIGSAEMRLTETYFFNRFDDYYAFMLLHFTQLGKPVRSCQCCGRFFVPKTKKITLYCDRVITSDGKTCKQVAPKLMQKLKKQQDNLLAEYDRVKNRNYKRFERGEWKLPGEETENDMTFEQYAAKLIAEEKFGRTVAYVDGKITANKLADIAGKKKLVDPKCQEVQAARELGISFGD